MSYDEDRSLAEFMKDAKAQATCIENQAQNLKYLLRKISEKINAEIKEPEIEDAGSLTIERRGEK